MANISFESASLDDATPLNEEVISAITVALESRIFSNDEVKEYGGGTDSLIQLLLMMIPIIFALRSEICSIPN